MGHEEEQAFELQMLLFQELQECQYRAGGGGARIKIIATNISFSM